ncbi:MAG: hypothetical protein ACTSYO_07280, partial [Candidatus Ranarchaeia archaeon]
DAYLTQEFNSPQIGTFTLSIDVYIDRIEDNGGYDRTGLIYIGDDHITTNCPTGTSNERFVFMAFYDPTPGDAGDDLEIRARTSSSQSYSTTSSWTTIATGLRYDTWYTIKIVINVASGTYDVYVDGDRVASSIPKYSGYASSYVTHISFAADSDGRGDFYVDNVTATLAEQQSQSSYPAVNNANHTSTVPLTNAYYLFSIVALALLAFNLNENRRKNFNLPSHFKQKAHIQKQ